MCRPSSAIEEARSPWKTHSWAAVPLLASEADPEPAQPVTNPADPRDSPGTVAPASAADIETALASAAPWNAPAAERAAALNRAADLYEENYGQIFALLTREAGKTPARRGGRAARGGRFPALLRGRTSRIANRAGIFTCISPWNFPLAIFSGQIAAALATGNAVLAKPAEQTPLIAHLAVAPAARGRGAARRAAAAARRRGRRARR